MSEWNVIHENFHTKHSVLTAPDEHMPYIIQFWDIMSIQPANKAAEHLIRDRQTDRQRQRQRDRVRETSGQIFLLLLQIYYLSLHLFFSGTAVYGETDWTQRDSGFTGQRRHLWLTAGWPHDWRWSDSGTWVTRHLVRGCPLLLGN